MNWFLVILSVLGSFVFFVFVVPIIIVLLGFDPFSSD